MVIVEKQIMFLLFALCITDVCYATNFCFKMDKMDLIYENNPLPFRVETF